MRLVSGIEKLGVPELFARAERRIFLHAAVYGPFARSESHMHGMEKALTNPGFKRLDVIALQSQIENAWSDSFLSALRFGKSKQSVAQEVDLSQTFLKEMSENYPEKFFVHPLVNLPCQPLLIVDDTICFGQYAHSGVHASQGFWGCVETDVEKLFRWAESGDVPQGADSEEVAAFRLVSDCFRAMECLNTSKGVGDVRAWA